MKSQILTSFQNVQHPNTGQNIQHIKWVHAGNKGSSEYMKRILRKNDHISYI